MRNLKALATAAAMVTLIAAKPASAGDPEAPVQAVDAMNKLFGAHPGFRANHAKGVVAEGSFKASPEAAALSKAAIFSGAEIPVIVRFSDATGVPNIPDGSANANPHGVAIKYRLPGGDETDMVINSLKFFPVANVEDFRDLLVALGDSPPGAPKPTKFEQFAVAHPSVAAAGATAKTPASFADEEYFGIDAFVLVNKAGAKQAVRYQLKPAKLVHLDSAEAAKKAPDFLIDELSERLAKGPATFRLQAQLASPQDQTKDPSKPWPDDRKIVDLGVLTLDKVSPDSLAAQKGLSFTPGRIIDGIELSDDPLVESRDAAYAVSVSRRNP
ncbi:catalase [Methylocapsa palsarum]|uniref:Catalase-related peroxidase n=2 Tax=Methylocapsa palsarum TaxID=1612308 RepID=A0A1I3XVY0_9HYPH|nr:catalase [Methylocapsa palsarum]